MRYLEQVLVCKKYATPLIVITTEDSNVDCCNDYHSTCTDEIIHCRIDHVQHQQPKQLQVPVSISPQCAICLEDFVDGDMIFESSSINAECKHEFHQSCIHQWCMIQTNCPCCRRQLLFRSDNIINKNNSF
jgi:hypothetical protein